VDGTAEIKDPQTRLAALQAVFPGMAITADPKPSPRMAAYRRTKGDPLDFPDMFAKDAAYRVIGQPRNTIEGCTSADILTMKVANTRRVHLKLWPWPKEGDSGLLAVLQYDFAGANPAMSCPTLGLLAHLTRKDGQWHARDQFALNTLHHWTLAGARVLDLAGEGAVNLVIESNAGGAGVVMTEMYIFDLSHGRFDLLVVTNSREDPRGNEDQLAYRLKLDIPRTVATHGRQFCLTRHEFYAKGEWFVPPRVTQPCLDADHKAAESYQADSREMLGPPK
jgi:hypothetical protein